MTTFTTFNVKVEIAGFELECELDYRFPYVWDSASGDPWQPDTQERSAVAHAYMMQPHNGMDMKIDILPLIETLGEAAEEKLNELALEAARDQIDSYGDPGDDEPGDQFKPDTRDEE